MIVQICFYMFKCPASSIQTIALVQWVTDWLTKSLLWQWPRLRCLKVLNRRLMIYKVHNCAVRAVSHSCNVFYKSSHCHCKVAWHSGILPGIGVNCRKIISTKRKCLRGFCVLLAHRGWPLPRPLAGTSTEKCSVIAFYSWTSIVQTEPHIACRRKTSLCH